MKLFGVSVHHILCGLLYSCGEWLFEDVLVSSAPILAMLCAEPTLLPFRIEGNLSLLIGSV